MSKTAFQEIAAPIAPTPGLGHVHAILDRCTTRGRNHVFEGIAKLFAERTGRKFVGTQFAQLAALYPDQEDGHLTTYFNEHGWPDVIFTATCLFATWPPNIFEITEVTKYIWELDGYRNRLTCHHLDTARLEKEKKIFEQEYKNIRDPLIAVLVIRTKTDPVTFSKKLIDIASQNPAATIFLCGTWRTEEKDHQELYELLQQEISQRNIGDFINIENFVFPITDTGYNPYIGLIAKADHVIICGESRSMMSEVLSTGKTAILHDGDIHTPLSRGNLIDYFSDLERSENFPTRNITPINITSEVVDLIIKDYKKHGGYVPEQQMHRAPGKDLTC